MIVKLFVQKSLYIWICAINIVLHARTSHTSHTRETTNYLSVVSIINPCHNCNDQIVYTCFPSIGLMINRDGVGDWRNAAMKFMLTSKKLCHLVLDTLYIYWFNLSLIISFFHYSSVDFILFSLIPMLASLHFPDCCVHLLDGSHHNMGLRQLLVTFCCGDLHFHRKKSKRDHTHTHPHNGDDFPSSFRQRTHYPFSLRLKIELMHLVVTRNTII